MEKKNNLSEIKREFLEEIAVTKVSLDDLKKAKVSNVVLETEVALRNIFGDEIFEKEKATETIEGEKAIIKLTDEDIAFDSEVQKITEDLVDLNFETGVNIILSKQEEQEEE